MTEKLVLTTDAAVAQIKRLRLLPGFPGNDPDAMEALIELLKKWFTGGKRGPRGNREVVPPEEQLVEAVDQVLGSDERWVGPARLKSINDFNYCGLALYGEDGRLLD